MQENYLDSGKYFYGASDKNKKYNVFRFVTQ